MGQLIDDLLTFSRVGRRDLTKMDISMNKVVNNLCQECKHEHTGNKIEFHIELLSPALADNMAIKQVWLNLISNAIKYSRSKETAIIEIGCIENDKEIIYFIKDNGAGFDMRYAGKLYGVFQRLHSDEEFEGTGVGLALVHRLISKHGGRVWAEGKVNGGATFYFTLPKP
jgi:light-regulated signal transduction histidine kinase (bacteriophytochrome)